MATGVMTPDERAFRGDLRKAPFMLGELEGRWKLESLEWPNALIDVTARDGLPYRLRFDLTNYPAAPPTARLWSRVENAALAPGLFPRSITGSGRVKDVFRTDWMNGTALYLPCDRTALAGHESWLQQMPSKRWQPSVGITHYLELVHELLNCPDYAPPAGA
ncbi:DUF7665 family protein [Paraburkholderia pallida]|uniref:Uncharacterized protein n=1 Tax=Paraburkholderia pallida TaxID=2547399 RepID=A0A4P7D6M0_9BURK|nr:hypothetical protein [Paraburkholderia pallida]QBR02495.1 hypothetical protein E1956_35220 [Paraburkholderia pallida]